MAKKLLWVLTYVERFYNRVPRDEVWQCLRQTGAKVKDIKVIQDMYMNCEAVEPCALGETEAFKFNVGLLQGPKLTPVLFAE